MSAPVDVLAVLDWLHDDHLEAGSYSGEGCYHDNREAPWVRKQYTTARAAVAALIAERDALRAELASAVAAEREACALTCDARRITDVEGDWDRGYNMALQDCNVAILARGAK